MTGQEHLDPPGRLTISKDFELSASHQLWRLPGTHKCSANHGHNYVVTLTLTADRLDEYGFVNTHTAWLIAEVGGTWNRYAPGDDHKR